MAGSRGSLQRLLFRSRATVVPAIGSSKAGVAKPRIFPVIDHIYSSASPFNKNSNSLMTMQFPQFPQFPQFCCSTLTVGEDDSREEQRLPGTTFIGVQAYFLGTSIDLRGLQAECMRFGYEVVRTDFSRANYLIIGAPVGHESPSSKNGKGSSFRKDIWSENRYIVAFQYGSVVFLNFSDKDKEEKHGLQFCQKHTSGLLTEISKDDYGILEKPSLEKWMQDGPDYIVLKRFDIDCIRIIGSVLGQSIALDHFARQVDGMVVEFTELNRGMEKAGTFTLKQQNLFRLVNKANSNIADVILKLRFLERSDIAWKDAKYDEIWEYLRDEYQLTERFNTLNYKLKFVEVCFCNFPLRSRALIYMENAQHFLRNSHNVLPRLQENARHFLQILHDKKSNSLEWTIIFLISAGILIEIWDKACRNIN